MSTILGIKIGTVLVFFLANFFLVSCRRQKVCIVPDNQGDVPSYCEKTRSINQFCKDAGDIVGNTVISVLSGNHSLSTTCEVRNVSSLTLKGQNESRATIKCDHSGFRFLYVTSLMISGMEFRGCGANWFITKSLYHDNYTTISPALLFFKGSSLILTNVMVSDGKSAGIYI
jgi:hypothetical protein